MRIATFYSFKGGVGRSLCLLNVAYQLGMGERKRIGLIDFDIESSGLHHILGQTAKADGDLLHLLEPSHRDLSRLEDHILELPFGRRGEPRVFLLPTVTDSELLDRVNWDVATQLFLFEELFPTFGRVYNLDYLFLDSRSGLSVFAIFALKKADLEVLVCRPDNQNRYGIGRIVKVCQANSKPFRVVISGCPEKERSTHVQRFERAIGARVDHVLPYDWRLYYEEAILSHVKPQHRLAKKYLKLSLDIREALDAAG